MSERETVKEEVARLRRWLNDLTWASARQDTRSPEFTQELERIERRIDYLTREYIARGIIYEPEH